MYEQYEKAVNKNTATLLETSSLRELQQLHLAVTGIATKLKDKKLLAQKISEKQVRELAEEKGIEVPPLKPQAKKSMAKPPLKKVDTKKSTNTEIDPNIAREALERVRSAWDTTEALREERKGKLAELKKGINDSRDLFTNVMKDGSMDDSDKVVRLEEAWKALVRLEEKRAAKAKEYTEKIKICTQTLKKEMHDIRQLTLF